MVLETGKRKAMYGATSGGALLVASIRQQEQDHFYIQEGKWQNACFHQKPNPATVNLLSPQWHSLEYAS